MLSEVQKLSGRAAEKKIGELKGDEIAMSFFKYALDPQITFGMTLPDSYPDFDSAYDKELSTKWGKLFTLLDDLRHNRRKSTAMAAVKDLDRHYPEVRPILRRVINKDLRLGLGPAKINKIFPGLLQIFKVQLASEGNIDKLEFPMFVEPKLDGVRCIAVIKDGRVTLFSRSGKIFQNFRVIEEKLLEICKTDRMVYDGEIISRDFQTLMTQTNRLEENASVSPIEIRFAIFDGMTYSEFVNHKCRLSMIQRRTKLLKTLNPDPSLQVVLVESTKVNSMEQFLDQYRLRVEQGFEGVMVKNNGNYRFSRSKNWLKFKPTCSEDLKVVDFVEGTGKFRETLGALVVEVEQEVENPLKNGKKAYLTTKVNVGSGFSDADRQEIWANRNYYRGMKAEVIYQERTKDGSLRFPRFKCWKDEE